jgi:L-lactate dehydrogenase
MDLQHAVPLACPARVWAGDYADVEAADIVVIAAGVGTRSGETRLDLLCRNVIVIREIMQKLRDTRFDGIILMITNPVDILAQVAQGESDLPVERVIGSGTVLDTVRLRAILGEELGIEARSIHAYIVGEHGNSEVATWCAARVGGVPLTEFCQPNCPDFPQVLHRVRDAAPEIIKHKGYTSFAIAACVTRICEAILRNENTILPLSTMTSGQYGISGIYLSLPCVVGRDGVKRIIEVPLKDTEIVELLASASLLKRVLAELKKEMSK